MQGVELRPTQRGPEIGDGRSALQPVQCRCGVAYRDECRHDEPVVGPPWPVRNQRPSAAAVSRASEDGGEHAFHHHVPGLQPVRQLRVLPGSGHVAPPQAGQRPPAAREGRGGIESDGAVSQSHRERAITHVRPSGQIDEGDRAPRIERERQMLLQVRLGVPPQPAQDRTVLMVRLRVLGVEGDGSPERFHRALHGAGVDEGEQIAARHPGVGGGRIPAQRAVGDDEPADCQALDRGVRQPISVAAGDRVGVGRPPDRRREPGVEPLGFAVFGEGPGGPIR